MDEETLDPADWPEFRGRAHRMLDAALDRMEGAREGRVWTPLPEAMKAALRAPLPRAGCAPDDLPERLAALLPYGVGNTHPRFFGWVHGAGNPGGILAEMTAAAMNANLGGRDHGAIYVERQVLDWCRQMMGFPAEASGLIVSGSSMATVVALKAARDRACAFDSRKAGVPAGLVGYASEQAHSCVARAFDMLGLGSDALRLVPCDAAFAMDAGALRQAVARDEAAGLRPFVIVGTAGAVNVGAIDPLPELADLAAERRLWLHVDGAFGAAARLCPEEAAKVAGLERADSLAFDFHKWLHVNYDAGCVLVRDADAHRRAFAERPDYLAPATRGLAAGGDWPVDFGPELSRGFRALKIWAHLLEHGTERLGRSIGANCAQARYLATQVESDPEMELLAPVALNICCFRYAPAGADALDALNDEIVIRLQEEGIAAPSTTRLNGRTAIRVNITNHRTRRADLELLLDAVRRIGGALAAAGQ